MEKILLGSTKCDIKISLFHLVCVWLEEIGVEGKGGEGNRVEED